MYAFTLAAFFFLLFGQTLAIILLHAENSVPTSVSLLVNAGPLLFFLRGVLHGRIRTHKLLTLVIWFYFCAGIWNVVIELTRSLGVVQITGSLLIFASSMLYVRSYQQTTS